MINNKYKRILSLVIILVVICLAFSGCRNIFNVLEAEYVGAGASVKNQSYYLSEVERLMNTKGYVKSDKSYAWSNIYGMDFTDIYELDNDMIFMFGTRCYDGKEDFIISVFASSDNAPDKSALNLPLVSEVLNIVSGYEISPEYLSEFCDEAKQDEYYGSSNYISDESLDYHSYYELDYISNPDASVIPVSIGNYNHFLLISGLTKTGLKQK